MRGFVAAAIGLMMVVGSAQAEEDSCVPLATLAKSIMSGRQNGAEMSNMVGIIRDGKSSPEFKKLAKALIISAFESPRFSTEDMKGRSITDFQNKVYLECTKNS